MTTDTLTKLTPRENECFEDMDRVLDRMLGETDWRATRRTFLAGLAPYTAAYHVGEFDELKDYTDDERAAAAARAASARRLTTPPQRLALTRCEPHAFEEKK